MRVATDIGGTFTDLVAISEGRRARPGKGPHHAAEL